MASPSDGRMAVYLGGNLALTRTIYGHKIFVDTSDVSLTPHLLLDGFWEQWITTVFRQVVTPGMSVVEIGANVGYYSLMAAELIGPSGNLFLFEANPHVAKILFRNIEVNGFLDRAKICNKAVYSSTCKLPFNIYEAHAGSSSLFPSTEYAAQYQDVARVVEIDTVSLDDYFPPQTKIDFMKIDAEGAEPHILVGGAKLIANNPQLQIMLEYSQEHLNRSYGIASRFFEDIKTLGFNIFKIEYDSTLVAVGFEELAQISYCDLLLRK